MSMNRRLRASLAAVAVAGVTLALAAPADAAPPKRVAAPVISVSPVSPTNHTSATFTWTEATTGVTFACTFDGATVPCGTTQSKTVTGLTSKTHTFTVRASRSGWKTATASKTLVVDLVAPAVPTVSAPPAVTKSGIAPTFTDSAGDLAGYECSVDGDVFAGCVSGATITVTGDGRHDLAVRAVDNVGNVSGNRTVSWILDTSVSKPFIASGPSPLTTSVSASFSFGAADTDAVLSCQLVNATTSAAVAPNPVPFSACTSGTPLPAPPVRTR